MSALYFAADPFEAQILRDYLGAQGIAVRIDGAGLWAARGELPLEYPRLFLLDAADEPRAHNPSIWRCRCGENSPQHFELCWSCGAERA